MIHREPPRIAVRVANLVYWLGVAGAVVFAVLALSGVLFGTGAERFWTALFFALAAGLAWLAGRLARFLVLRR